VQAFPQASRQVSTQVSLRGFVQEFVQVLLQWLAGHLHGPHVSPAERSACGPAWAAVAERMVLMAPSLSPELVMHTKWRFCTHANQSVP